MRAIPLAFKRAKRLRREMTLPEVLIWQAIRRGQLDGARFRHQHPMGPYILDFYCAEPMLCVEVDGRGHDSPEAAGHDERRDAWLAERGVRVLRLPAALILDRSRFADAVQTIADAVAPSTTFGGPPPPPRG